MGVCSRLKSIIHERKLKQSEIAKQIGTTSNKLSSALNGKRALKLEMFFALCGVLDVDPNIYYEYPASANALNLWGKSIAVTTTDGKVIAVITANKIIEHNGYEVVFVED